MLDVQPLLLHRPPLCLFLLTPPFLIPLDLVGTPRSPEDEEVAKAASPEDEELAEIASPEDEGPEEAANPLEIGAKSSLSASRLSWQRAFPPPFPTPCTTPLPSSDRPPSCLRSDGRVSLVFRRRCRVGFGTARRGCCREAEECWKEDQSLDHVCCCVSLFVCLMCNFVVCGWLLRLKNKTALEISVPFEFLSPPERFRFTPRSKMINAESLSSFHRS